MALYYNSKQEAYKAKQERERMNVRMLASHEARSKERPHIEQYFLGHVYEVPRFLGNAFIEAGLATPTKQRSYDKPILKKPIFDSSAESWSLF